MEADLNTSTNFYFLNQNFEVIHKLTQYESLMWVDKYDEPGNFEIYAPPTPEIKAAAQIDNYFMSDKSKHLMIVEKLETTVSPDDGERLIISGRSLESILERRVLFLKCYFRDKNSEATPSSSTAVGADNLEDAIRQLLEYLFISPVHWDNDSGTWVEAADRKVDNFVFEYSSDWVPIVDTLNRPIIDQNKEKVIGDSLDSEVISNIVLKDCEFDKGDNALNIVNTIVKQAGLGYQITLNSQHQFVFKLIKGENRTSDQFKNPAVIFAPKFNNLKSSKFTDDRGENFRNFVYTEGETYKSQRPTIVETGDATGLLRREVYVNSEVQHETESSNVTHDGIVKEKKKLTEEEYQAALAEDATKYYKKYASKTTLESEIEPRLTFQYGRDFGIGDILEVQDGTGNSGKVRCVEFIISHSHSGYEEYPTFESYIDPEEDEPAQSSGSGGEYTNEGNSNTGDSGNMTASYTSNDTTDANASGWLSVDKLVGGEKHSVLFNLISKMFQNIRWLKKSKIDIVNSSNKVLLGKITSTAANSSVTYSERLDNFTFVIVTVTQGYESIVYCGPVGGSIDTISISHGRPHGSYGAQGMVIIGLTSASLREALVTYGWTFTSVNIYGVK